MPTPPPKKPVAKPIVAIAPPTVSTGGATAPKQTLVPVAKKPGFMIRTSEDRGTNPYIKFLVYANHGVGKTLLAGSSAEVESMRDVLMISAEGGDLTLDDAAKERPMMADIDSIRVVNYDQLSQVHAFLKTHCLYRDLGTDESEQKLRDAEARFKGCDVEDIEEPRHYRTAIIDSLTEVEVYCMMQLLKVTDATGLAEEVQSAEWSEYKKQHSMMQRMVRAFRDLPMNIIFTCARQYTQDELKRMLYAPQLTGKLAGQIQGFMDVVGYLVTGQPNEDGKLPRRMHVQPTGKFDAKCRFVRFKGTYFDDPTMSSILKAVGLLD